MGFFRKGSSRSKSPPPKYIDLFDFLIKEDRLAVIVNALGTDIRDLVSLTLVNKALWAQLAADHKLWRAVYLGNDPLITPDIR